MSAPSVSETVTSPTTAKLVLETVMVEPALIEFCFA